jgi:hypothetical protein
MSDARATVLLLPLVGGLTALAPMASGCGTATAANPRGAVAREVVMAYDDARATGTLAFPSMTYETIVRFELPEGEHRPIRLRFQAAAPGKLEVTIYDTTLLETPGEVLRTVSCDLTSDDVSNGKDGRWVVADLAGMKPLKGVAWIGVRKSGGEPTLWTSSVVSGEAFIRNNDPHNLMGLLPTKRTPMIRLEIAP